MGQIKIEEFVKKLDLVNMPADIEYQSGSVVSKTLYKEADGTVTLFAFDKGQALSEHSAPFNATVHVLDGKVEIRIGGKPSLLNGGQKILMPADIPHGLTAVDSFKMLLVMEKQ